jgi:hypothetical protein
MYLVVTVVNLQPGGTLTRRISGSMQRKKGKDKGKAFERRFSGHRLEVELPLGYGRPRNLGMVLIRTDRPFLLASCEPTQLPFWKARLVP